jgi:hypothetical protein
MTRNLIRHLVEASIDWRHGLRWSMSATMLWRRPSIQSSHRLHDKARTSRGGRPIRLALSRQAWAIAGPGGRDVECKWSRRCGRSARPRKTARCCSIACMGPTARDSSRPCTACCTKGWTNEQALHELKNGGYGYHAIWTNIEKYQREVDVTHIRQRVQQAKP